MMATITSALHLLIETICTLTWSSKTDFRRCWCCNPLTWKNPATYKLHSAKLPCRMLNALDHDDQRIHDSTPTRWQPTASTRTSRFQRGKELLLCSNSSSTTTCDLEQNEFAFLSTCGSAFDDCSGGRAFWKNDSQSRSWSRVFLRCGIKPSNVWWHLSSGKGSKSADCRNTSHISAFYHSAHATTFL